MRKPFLPIIAGVLSIGIVVLSANSVVASSIDKELRKILDLNKIKPITKPKASPAKVELGRMLFWDKILSGNQNIGCATCHLPEAATSDALPLSIGEGGVGKMRDRKPPKNEKDTLVFVPRNSLDIFNRGNFEVMFWDGRVRSTWDGKTLIGNTLIESGKIWTPAGFILPDGLDNALAAQAMFPPTSDTEMRGNPHENPLGDMKNWEFRKIWSTLINKILSIPEYVDLLAKSYPDIPRDKLSFVQAANAIAAFEIEAFTLTDAPFDRYLQGDNGALSDAEKRGALIFYGKGNCGTCHSGPLMTDQLFHNRLVPQIGPGKGAHIPAGGADGTWDLGRGGVTPWTEDRFCFRTPPLRNVEKTGPWMHDGAFGTLEAAVRHELDPKKSAKSYDPKAQLPDDFAITCKTEQAKAIARLADPSDIAAVSLDSSEVDDLMAFLKSLTSPSLDELVKLTPERVPSGLPVRD